MRRINVNVSIADWFAIDRAEGRGLLISESDSWASEADLRNVPGKLVWEDARGAGGLHQVVTETDNSIVSLAREGRMLSASVYGASRESNRRELASLRELFPPAQRTANLLEVTFWYHSNNGPRAYGRKLEAPSWKDIEENYPAATRSALAGLHGIKAGDHSGKLLLWRGEPGTGKTFALRAMAEEWASWCAIHCVLDPENFFDKGDYLLSVILGSKEVEPGPASDGVPGGERPEWRLIVLEDAGEMLARDAKLQVGQGLARLLNLCDGMLGQGLRILVLITTNEEVRSLHPAVSRPGRCLSEIFFDKFDGPSAARWLERRGGTAAAMKSTTLAELYALLRGGAAEVPARKVAGF
jgi:hypothetical protein